MDQNSSFTIYNASAGSGKTFTLVKDFLKILLASKNNFLFKNILAITFTNKAVNEMKERIIKMLSQFSEPAILNNPNPMFTVLCDELEISPENLHNKSIKLLKIILHNYASLNISTIDGFTHRVIRTFAYDLKLPMNFEVELEKNLMLNEAVDSLIAKAGTNEELTKVLVDFAIEKADDDKSWNIAYDLNKIGSLLFSEHDHYFLDKLKDKTLDDFKDLKNTLNKEIENSEKLIIEIADKFLSLISEAGLKFDDFLGGSRAFMPNYFLKLQSLNLNVDFSTAWVFNLEDKPLYPIKSTSDDIKYILDELQPKLVSIFNESKKEVEKLKFLKAFYKNITPLSIINAISKELKQLKQEQNKLLISEFNSLISSEIKDQPTPFIYERIGEKFKHYFIDEFQDTSIMQWENLKPLIDNALSSENNSALLVGDAKQAIYRWRGGKAEQFIALTQDLEPFQIKKTVQNLDTNFRSFKEIINFNNGFFKFLAENIFIDNAYQSLYYNARQNLNIKNKGYVELNFLDISKEDDKDLLFAENVLEIINRCMKNGFRFEDICILVRKKDKEALPLANFLSQHRIPVVSSDSLLLINSPKVTFLNNFLTLLSQPNNHVAKIEILDFLASYYDLSNKHAFFEEHLAMTTEAMIRACSNFGAEIKYSELTSLSLYDLTEFLVRDFGLVKDSDAYLQTYMDCVLDYANKNGSDLTGFLNHFEKNKNKLSISSPAGLQAVQIMTIHKAKGLEFPVVIFPYADLDIYAEIEPKEWYKIDEKIFNGFTHTLLNFNKDIQYFGEQGSDIYQRRKAELELDNINLLYVALTRAVEQLFIISKKEKLSKSNSTLKRYSEMLIAYLQDIGIWEDNKSIYLFGDSEREQECLETRPAELPKLQFISTAKESHNIHIVTKQGYLWDTTQKEALEKGILIHDILSEIETIEDLDPVLIQFLEKGIITDYQQDLIKTQILQIIKHPKLADFFNADLLIHNERDIIDTNGNLLRPDRFVINSKNEGTLLDYKTGIHYKHYEQQLRLYQDVLENMGFQIKNKILVYINDSIIVKEISN